VKRIELEIEPISVFGWELDKIVNEQWRSMCALALYRAPNYFWTAPASTSGKYHPRTSLGMGGLINHTKAAFLVAENLFTNETCAPFTDEQKDIIRIAIILHDCCKQGFDGLGHTAPNHPMLVRSLLKVFEPEDLEVVWDDICGCIDSHMGQWNTNKEKVEILPKPQTEMQKFVHLCDFIASRKDIEVDVNRREGHTKEESAWKDERASEGQINFIAILVKKATDSGVSYSNLPFNDVGVDTLTKGLASDIITAYKKVLGMGDK